MAITINEFKLPITADEARSYLQRQTDDFGVFFDVDRCYEIVGILQLDMRRIQREFNEIVHRYVSLENKDAVVDSLIDMGVDPYVFNSKGRKKTSGRTFDAFTRQAILLTPGYGEDIRTAVELYSKYTSHKRNKGNILNFALLPNSVQLSKYNHRMSIGHPTWRVLSTSRIAASDPGVQGIPRATADIITEPKGYTLVRCDSGQIEPRINFSAFLRDELIMNLITEYNDAYFGLLHYALMTPEEDKACRENFQANFHKIEITDAMKENRQSLKRLTNAGSYGSSHLDDIDPVLSKAYEDRILKHPARLALERKVTEDVEHGVETFYGFFGTPVTPDATERYQKDMGSWKEHVIRCGINNPVQTTASELMMFSINEAKSILAKAKDTHICLYKHDEAMFYVSDEDMANGVGDILSSITAYNVKGWIPIDSECLIGVKKGDFPSVIL